MDHLDALLLAAHNGATDHLAALLLHFRTQLDEAGRLVLRQAARTSTGNELCLSSLERLEAARSAGLDVNAGVGTDGNLLLDYVNYRQEGCVAVLLATEPSLDPSLPMADGINVDEVDERGRTWLHLAARYGHTDCLKTLLAMPGE